MSIAEIPPDDQWNFAFFHNVTAKTGHHPVCSPVTRVSRVGRQLHSIVLVHHSSPYWRQMSTTNRASDSADESRERMSQATLSMFDGVVASWNLKTFEGIPTLVWGKVVSVQFVRHAAMLKALSLLCLHLRRRITVGLRGPWKHEARHDNYTSAEA